MCGIAGIFTFDQSAGKDPAMDTSIRKMTNLMERRGPDAEEYWKDPEGHLNLGFRRLAIQDLSSAGNQPMVSGNGRSVVVFNGEIYNFKELREELQGSGVQFRSESDTEVLLEALEKWGIDALDRLNGMFAFAWYDKKERKLTLARDHVGIKPLYYFIHPGNKGVAFGSQYNCLLHTPWKKPGNVRKDVLYLYLRLHHIPAPYGLLENTYQLEPGHYLVMHANGKTEKKVWWSFPRDPEPTIIDSEQAVEVTLAALRNATKRQLIADVPLGTYLSGGIDSPLVTACAKEKVSSELKAFTIGNPGWRQDETQAAIKYAKAIGVDHKVWSFNAKILQETVKQVLEAQHEPFADFSMIPSLLMSGFAKKEITVALSGDGGDELFFGYERPMSLLRNGSDFRFPWLVRLALYGAGKYGIGPKRSDVITFQNPGDYYFDVNTRIKDEDLKLIAPEITNSPRDFKLYQCDQYRNVEDLANYSRWVEVYGQLQRCLKKVDMASMYHSLEIRVPMLDREVIEASLKINSNVHMQSKFSKAVLKNALTRFVPENVISKTKLGFSVPLREWLCGSLREMVESTLLSGKLASEGLIDQENIRFYWNEHLSGEKDRKWGIWTLLSLEWWMKENFKFEHGE